MIIGILKLIGLVEDVKNRRMGDVNLHDLSDIDDLIKDADALIESGAIVMR